MTRLTSAIAVITALSAVAAAVVCTSSETYCGSRLLRDGPENRKAVEGALTSGKQVVDDAHIKQSVFWCVPPGVPVPGDSGLLFVTYCGPTNICHEGGALGGVGDACVPKPEGKTAPRE